MRNSYCADGLRAWAHGEPMGKGVQRTARRTDVKNVTSPRRARELHIIKQSSGSRGKLSELPVKLKVHPLGVESRQQRGKAARAADSIGSWRKWFPAAVKTVRSRKETLHKLQLRLWACRGGSARGYVTFLHNLLSHVSLREKQTFLPS